MRSATKRESEGERARGHKEGMNVVLVCHSTCIYLYVHYRCANNNTTYKCQQTKTHIHRARKIKMMNNSNKNNNPKSWKVLLGTTLEFHCSSVSIVILLIIMDVQHHHKDCQHQCCCSFLCQCWQYEIRRSIRRLSLQCRYLAKKQQCSYYDHKGSCMNTLQLLPPAPAPHHQYQPPESIWLTMGTLLSTSQ